jgi:hypothetical protein
MIKSYGQIFENGVMSMITTPDKKYLFAANKGGRLKQISLESQEVVHDYEQIHNGQIPCLETTRHCVETTRHSKWLITGSKDMHVKRISIENREVDKDFGQVCAYPIRAMKITACSEK